MNLHRTTPSLLLLTLPLVGCGEEVDASPVRLEVTVQGWSGWSEVQPEPTTTTHAVEESGSFTVDTIEGELEVTVVEVSEDEVELETSKRMAPRSESGGGWDHNHTTTDFTLQRGDQVELSTPTLDAGTTVTIAEE